MSSTPSEAQDHDRIRTDNAPSALRPDDDALPDDISITHKMMSAVAGSVLTSLLGESALAKGADTASDSHLVTPLDVVRVRLQSQQRPAPNTTSALRNTASFRKFSNLPPNIGVTACCREVFWVNNNAPFCVAGEGGAVHLGSIPGATSVTQPHAECEYQEIQRRNFTSVFDGLRKIARNEGITTLWRGLSPTLVMAVPGNVIYFAGYDWLRSSPHSPMHGRVSDVYSPLIAGSAARVFAALFVSPVELFRTRMQAHHSKDAATNLQETIVSVKEMVSSQGVHTLWRGLTLTLWRDVPFSALYWWGYEAGRTLLTDSRDRAGGREVDRTASITRRRDSSRNRQDNTTVLIDSFIAGAGSGFFASLVTTPFDVGKTRQQVLRHAGDSKGAGEAGEVISAEMSSMPRLLLHIYRDEGMAGLFRGWVARCLKVAPACAIMISSYEIGKRMAASMKKEEEADA